jgi:hypothetical protein
MVGHLLLVVYQEQQIEILLEQLVHLEQKTHLALSLLTFRWVRFLVYWKDLIEKYLVGRCLCQAKTGLQELNQKRYFTLILESRNQIFLSQSLFESEDQESKSSY